MSFALVVRLKIKADSIDKFMSAVKVNGKAARETEPGCRTFDILHDPQDPTSAMLYEVYDDAAAFEAHQQTPHFKKYLDTALQWLDHRERQIMTRVAP
jgi:quinol monooxygenase YgiN